MYTKQSKKMLPVIVLDILKRYTDENHRLSQREIEKHLSDKYDMVVDRRSVKRSIMDLIDMGFDIEYSETTRSVKDKKSGEYEEQAVLSDFYLERDFSDCEIRLLIDELLDSKYVPTRQRKQLISKLEGLSSVYFRKSKAATRRMIEDENQDNQLFYSIDVIDEAIASGCKVGFDYRHYRLGKGDRIEQEQREYVVMPYDMQVIDGEYILICCGDDSSEMDFRMDYISGVYIVDERIPKRTINPDTRDMRRIVRFLSSEDMLASFVGVFGISSIHTERRGDETELIIRTDEETAVDFAVKHSDRVTVLEPETCRNKVVSRLEKGLGRYSKAAV